MPIVAGDIEYRLSGGAANSNPATSLGGAKSSVEAVAATLFDDVSGAESAAGDTEYRCIYIQNNHGTLTLQNAVLWIQSNSTSPHTEIQVALGGEGKNGTAETVANENTAPVGETFALCASKGAGLSLGNLAPAEYYPVWIRRVVTAGAAAAADTFTIRVEGDTAP